MWIVVYVAEQKSTAHHIRQILSDEGVLVKIRCTDDEAEHKDGLYEILVPQSEASETHSILMEHGY